MTDENSGERTDGSNESPMHGLTGSNLLQTLQEFVSEHPFLSQVGIAPKSFDDGVLRATVPYDEQFTNPMPNDPLNGGFLLTALDTIMGLTVQAATFDDEAAASGPTININTNFLSAATGDLEAEGKIVRLGGSNAVVKGRLRDVESGNLVATAQGTWRLYRTD